MSSAHLDPESRERLLALAAAAAPPPLEATDARRMVRRAQLAGSARRRTAGERTTFGFALSALASVALVALGLRVASHATVPTGTARLESAQPTAATPLRMQLPSHDTLVATPGAQFDLVDAEPSRRRVQLGDGAIAFDVAKLSAGQSFAVVTPHVTVRVRGTVFSVAASAQRTEVRVYEGVVAVDVAGGERLLRRGESYASDGSVVAQDTSAPLQRDASEMAARRECLEGVHVELAAAPAAAPTVVPEVAPAVVPAVAPAASEPRARPAESLRQARAWLHEGQAERALAAALRAGTLATPQRGDWQLLQADALRSLGRGREAALAYREAALALSGERRAQAGFKAAEVLLRELDDPLGALAALHVAGVDGPGAALRERGLLLRIEALERSGQPIAEVVARYLAEYPESAGAPRLRARLEAAR